MSQSNTIFGYLAVAFVVFITMRGELPVYLGFLLSNPSGDLQKRADQGAPHADKFDKVISAATKVAPYFI